ncbi:unnamed protein product [Spirodela intermedia]|uniref:Uncharacterized protein n=1 Tax=Spirodela intermedia TaxID=51605 RepID=A0ABN7EDQ8_SPIIN|nr:unnamed protein product [Spirodela intermedia]
MIVQEHCTKVSHNGRLVFEKLYFRRRMVYILMTW